MVELTGRLPRPALGVGLLVIVAILAYVAGRIGSSPSPPPPTPVPIVATENDILAFNFPMPAACPKDRAGRWLDNTQQSMGVIKIGDGGASSPDGWSRIPPIIPSTGLLLPVNPASSDSDAAQAAALETYAEVRHLITIMSTMYKQSQKPGYTGYQYNCEFTIIAPVPVGTAKKLRGKLQLTTPKTGCLLNDQMAIETTICLSVPGWKSANLSPTEIMATLSWAEQTVRIAEKLYLNN